MSLNNHKWRYLFKMEELLNKNEPSLDRERDKFLDVLWVRMLMDDEDDSIITSSHLDYTYRPLHDRPMPFKK